MLIRKLALVRGCLLFHPIDMKMLFTCSASLLFADNWYLRKRCLKLPKLPFQVLRCTVTCLSYQVYFDLVTPVQILNGEYVYLVAKCYPFLLVLKLLP